ncbi:GATA zinc finger domain-containing protein 14 [Angomonas deanei]|uniref:Uncharacterized protein n=1 Tax=Angomonas deanei TaxID=59799 RepID=A0A7G2CLV5_9TRYP|nr:GATA zinc finger domain-containing protein 14 [Angomonas deanei]CAD2219904.1 hypothetical protein, conserved [Angomonas deanei]|eukprot:EPY22328.1 GATA zinc finger domain-containing protein 14 [Angomonas deanei]
MIKKEYETKLKFKFEKIAEQQKRIILSIYHKNNENNPLNYYQFLTFHNNNKKEININKNYENNNNNNFIIFSGNNSKESLLYLFEQYEEKYKNYNTNQNYFHNNNENSISLRKFSFTLRTQFLKLLTSFEKEFLKNNKSEILNNFENEFFFSQTLKFKNCDYNSESFLFQNNNNNNQNNIFFTHQSKNNFYVREQKKIINPTSFFLSQNEENYMLNPKETNYYFYLKNENNKNNYFENFNKSLEQNKTKNEEEFILMYQNLIEDDKNKNKNNNLTITLFFETIFESVFLKYNKNTKKEDFLQVIKENENTTNFSLFLENILKTNKNTQFSYFIKAVQNCISNQNNKKEEINRKKENEVWPLFFEELYSILLKINHNNNKILSFSMKDRSFLLQCLKNIILDLTNKNNFENNKLNFFSFLGVHQHKIRYTNVLRYNNNNNYNQNIIFKIIFKILII